MEGREIQDLSLGVNIRALFRYVINMPRMNVSEARDLMLDIVTFVSVITSFSLTALSYTGWRDGGGAVTRITDSGSCPLTFTLVVTVTPLTPGRPGV